MNPRLHVVDGTFELFRAHYSKRPSFTAPDGRQLKATIGLLQSMIALLHDPSERLTHVAVAFDNPIRSFRNELFAGYKSDAGIDPELYAQFDAAEEALAALGFVVWSMKRYEAYDALATATARFAGEVETVRILSVDKDLGQCLTAPNARLVDRIRKVEYDAEGIRVKLGVAPALIPDYLALVGDSADGIPGLPGFGAKSAAALLNHFGPLDDVPRDVVWELPLRGAEKLRRTFVEHFDAAQLYRRLATLVRDVPLPQRELSELAFDGVPRSRFIAWAEARGASFLGERVERWR
ncbi:MAG: flap endonuclease [Myxococcales bacterium]|nr:flap endonuclease [Myxococcales bacterium]